MSHVCSRLERRRWLYANQHLWKDYDPFTDGQESREKELAKLFVAHGLYAPSHLHNINVKKLLQQVSKNEGIKCRFPACPTIQLKRWNLCGRHAHWVAKGNMTQDLTVLKKPRPVNIYQAPDEKCRIEGCENKPRRNWLCTKHSSSLRDGRMTQSGQRIIKRADHYRYGYRCTKCGFADTKITKGFCRLHYNQFRKGFIDYAGFPTNKKPKRIHKYPKDAVCIVGSCTKKPRIRGWCETHHAWFKKKCYDLTGNKIRSLTCSVLGCSKVTYKVVHKRERCFVHYKRKRDKALLARMALVKS